MLASGAVLQGKYLIEKTLGQGGMGAVYRARVTSLAGKPVAIKEMVVDIDDDAMRTAAIAQFHREAEMLAGLDHPNLVDVTDYFEEAGHQYLVMSLVDGQTLEVIANQAPGFLPIQDVVAWTQTLCDVLGYLHGQTPPIIFRDLKPDNIMLDSRQRIRLVDFGIARVFEAGSRTATFVKSVGTPGYSPVEQHGGSSTDPRSDVYALGATVYTLLTKTVPPVSVNLMSGDESLIPPEAINPAIPAALSAVVLKMMGLRKEDRYQSMADVRQALQEATGGAAAAVTAAPTAPQAVEKPFVVRTCRRCTAHLAPDADTCMVCGTPYNAPASQTPVATTPPAPSPVPVPARSGSPLIPILLVLAAVAALWFAHAHHHAAPPPPAAASAAPGWQ